MGDSSQIELDAARDRAAERRYLALLLGLGDDTGALFVAFIFLLASIPFFPFCRPANGVVSLFRPRIGRIGRVFLAIPLFIMPPGAKMDQQAQLSRSWASALTSINQRCAPFPGRALRHLVSAE